MTLIRKRIVIMVIRASESAEMIRVIELNLCEAFAFLPEYFHVEDDVTWFWMNQVPNAYINGIWNSKLPADCEKRIEEILAPFKSSKTPVTCYVTPYCSPSNLGSMLEKHGLPYEGEDPGMAATLSELPDMRMPEGLIIKRVENRAMLEQWSETFSIVFKIRKENMDKTMIFQEGGGYSPEAKVQRFIGIVDSKVVGTLVIAYPPGAAVLFGITVLDEYRSKGIGRAMTLYPLTLA
jgi:hypothetical protein